MGVVCVIMWSCLRLQLCLDSFAGSRRRDVAAGGALPREASSRFSTPPSCRLSHSGLSHSGLSHPQPSSDVRIATDSKKKTTAALKALKPYPASIHHERVLRMRLRQVHNTYGSTTQTISLPLPGLSQAISKCFRYLCEIPFLSSTRKRVNHSL